MNFTHSMWIFTGFFICIGLLFTLQLLQKYRLARLEKFASHKLLGKLTMTISPTRRRYKNVFILIAIFFCFVALARPQYGYKWVEVKRKGIDLLFAIDVSKSMLAQDIKPNRLKRASLAILDFVQQLEGDRVGLLPFAGSAYLMCPLTLDYEAFEHSLSAVNSSIIPRGGTNLPSVINKAVTTLDNEANHKILIILTDGENLQGDTLAAAAEAADKGLKIYTVGVGTSEGELIPLLAGGFTKDQQGNFVTSKLDEKTLTEIADKTGALYVPLGTGSEGLSRIYQEKLSLIPKEELAERRHKVPLERPEWPLGLALLLLSIEFCIGERRVKHKLPSIHSLKKGLKLGKKLSLLLIIAVAAMPNSGWAGKGEIAYDQGNFLEAAEIYNKRLEKNPDDPILNYNFGTTSYKNNMLDDAIDAFTKALKSADVKLQQKAYFNLANSLYQKGAETLQADSGQTIDQWKEAINSLEAALELEPQNQPAKDNLDVIKKKLEELEKQQQEQQDNQKKQDEQDQNQQQEGTNKENSDNSSGDTDKADPSSSSEKNDEQETQQASPDKSEDGGQDENATQQAAQENSEKETQTSSSTEQAAEDAKRQELGKMTKEEAERLLNALKNEEGELNFVPAGSKDQETTKDW